MPWEDFSLSKVPPRYSGLTVGLTLPMPTRNSRSSLTTLTLRWGMHLGFQCSSFITHWRILGETDLNRNTHPGWFSDTNRTSTSNPHSPHYVDDRNNGNYKCETAVVLSVVFRCCNDLRQVYSFQISLGFIGLYPTAKVINPSAVCLINLPATLCHIHPTFHVSRIKPFVPKPLGAALKTPHFCEYRSGPGSYFAPWRLPCTGSVGLWQLGGHTNFIV